MLIHLYQLASHLVLTKYSLYLMHQNIIIFCMLSVYNILMQVINIISYNYWSLVSYLWYFPMMRRIIFVDLKFIRKKVFCISNTFVKKIILYLYFKYIYKKYFVSVFQILLRHVFCICISNTFEMYFTHHCQIIKRSRFSGERFIYLSIKLCQMKRRLYTFCFVHERIRIKSWRKNLSQPHQGQKENTCL